MDVDSDLFNLIHKINVNRCKIVEVTKNIMIELNKIENIRNILPDSIISMEGDIYILHLSRWRHLKYCNCDIIPHD